LHTGILSAIHAVKQSNTDQFGETLLPKLDGMSIYIQYSMNIAQARQCLERCTKEHKPLAAFLKSTEKAGIDSLDTLLQLPLTKLDHYMMFVEVCKRVRVRICSQYHRNQRHVHRQHYSLCNNQAALIHSISVGSNNTPPNTISCHGMERKKFTSY
jgi:hypothetical protein